MGTLVGYMHAPCFCAANTVIRNDNCRVKTHKPNGLLVFQKDVLKECLLLHWVILSASTFSSLVLVASSSPAVSLAAFLESFPEAFDSSRVSSCKLTVWDCSVWEKASSVAHSRRTKLRDFHLLCLLFLLFFHLHTSNLLYKDNIPFHWTGDCRHDYSQWSNPNIETIPCSSCCFIMCLYFTWNINY